MWLYCFQGLQPVTSVKDGDIDMMDSDEEEDGERLGGITVDHVLAARLRDTLTAPF